jgi:thioredoxin-dependent peroxiredoxin
MTMLANGTKAPEFELVDQDNKKQALKDYLGRWVVVYFYPKDNTPGCTKEACNFRDSYQQLLSKKVVILGISKDSVESHLKFAQKYQLNFPLLADPDKKVIKVYGAWGVKKFMGREFEGVRRITYLIDLKGMIYKGFEKVNPLIHAQEILKELEGKI